jgi:hypothetical protein
MITDLVGQGLDTLASIDDARGLLSGRFERSPVAFQIHRADGRCLLVDESFRQLFGSAPPPEDSVFEDDPLEKQGFLELVSQPPERNSE